MRLAQDCSGWHKQKKDMGDYKDDEVMPILCFTQNWILWPVSSCTAVDCIVLFRSGSARDFLLFAKTQISSAHFARCW